MIRVYALLALTFFSIFAGDVRAQQAPAPESGEGAAATLALARHAYSLCEGAADELTQQWVAAGENIGGEKLQEIVYRRLSGALAEAAAAGKHARRTVLQAGREDGSSVSAALDRLQITVDDLCAAVAHPNPSLQSFEAARGKLRDRWEREQKHLGGLIILSEKRVAAALEEFRPVLEAASQEAEKERNSYLEDRRPPPESPKMADYMRAWYPSYAQRVAPVKAALGLYLKGRSVNDGRRIASACRDLVSKTSDLLDDPRVFRAPDPRLEQPLYNAFKEIQLLAAPCSAGRFDRADDHQRRMEGHLRQAAAILALYDLQP